LDLIRETARFADFFRHIAVRHDYCEILVHYASAVKKIHLIEVRRQKPASLQIAGFFCLDFCQRQKSLVNQALARPPARLCTALSTQRVHKSACAALGTGLRKRFVLAQGHACVAY
jgi:hypothetical protein